MPSMTFPRTMTKGIFRGQTFNTAEQYYAALRRYKSGQSPQPAENGSGLSAGQIIGAYELLIQEGVGRTRAISILDVLKEGGQR